jgi:peptidoglycan hydrolase FlgJ
MVDDMNLATMPYQSMDLAKKMEALSHRVDSKKITAEDSSEIDKACTDMESLFIFYLLKEMRATIPKDGFVGRGKGEEIYTSMLDSQLAKELAAERGIGLSPLLHESLRRKENNVDDTVEKNQEKS